MLAYLVVRGNGAGPLFWSRDKKPLTRPCLVSSVRRWQECNQDIIKDRASVLVPPQ